MEFSELPAVEVKELKANSEVRGAAAVAVPKRNLVASLCLSKVGEGVAAGPLLVALSSIPVGAPPKKIAHGAELAVPNADVVESTCALKVIGLVDKPLFAVLPNINVGALPHKPVDGKALAVPNVNVLASPCASKVGAIVVERLLSATL